MPRARRDLLILALLVLVGLVLRLDQLVASNFVIDADEAIVGLMGKHIIETGEVPVFYYGQNYMGSFEPLLTAAVFKFSGVTPVALKIVPLIFSLLLIVVVYYLGMTLSGPLTASLAGLFCAIPPAPLVVWSAKARGGFIEVVVLGALALLECCYWLKGPTYFRTIMIGLLLGFGWWVNNQIVFFVAPIGFAMLCAGWNRETTNFLSRVKFLAAHVVTGIFAWFLGGLPFWIYNLQHDFVSFDILKGAKEGDLFTHLSGLFTVSFPILLGAKRFWEYTDIFPYSSLIICGLYAGLMVLVLCYRARPLTKLLLLKIDRESPVELFILFILTACAVFTLSSFGWLIHAPRYLLPVYVGIFLISAWIINLLSRMSRVTALTLTLLILAFNLSSSYLYGRSIPGEPYVFKQERVSKDHSELINWLDRNNIHLVRTNYWIGYRLAFETLEKVKFLMFQEPTYVRIADYEIASSETAHEVVPMVLVPSQWTLVSEALTQLGYSYLTEDLSGYKVIHSIHPLHTAEYLLDVHELHASATHAASAATGAIDGNIYTRWGSAAPQNPTMQFTVDIDRPREVSRLIYSAGQWRHDMPRALKIELEDEAGQRFLILDFHKATSIAYYIEASSDFSVYFSPRRAKRIILSQLGKDLFFDWSIAELHLYSTEPS